MPTRSQFLRWRSWGLFASSNPTARTRRAAGRKVLLPLAAGLAASLFRAAARDWPQYTVVFACGSFSAPFSWDSEYWQAQTDATVVCTLTLLKAAPFVPMISTTVRLQMAVFYLGAGFWKINTSFLDPASSCASIYIAQLLDVLGMESALPPAARTAAVRAGPLLTIVGELSIGLLLLVPRRPWAKLGVALALLLHLGIALTPPPNNIAEYGTMSALRLAWLFPHAVATAMAEPGWLAVHAGSGALLLAVLAARGPLFVWGGLDGWRAHLAASTSRSAICSAASTCPPASTASCAASSCARSSWTKDRPSTRRRKGGQVPTRARAAAAPRHAVRPHRGVVRLRHDRDGGARRLVAQHVLERPDAGRLEPPAAADRATAEVAPRPRRDVGLLGWRRPRREHQLDPLPLDPPERAHASAPARRHIVPRRRWPLRPAVERGCRAGDRRVRRAAQPGGVGRRLCAVHPSLRRPRLACGGRASGEAAGDLSSSTARAATRWRTASAGARVKLHEDGAAAAAASSGGDGVGGLREEARAAGAAGGIRSTGSYGLSFNSYGRAEGRELHCYGS